MPNSSDMTTLESPYSPYGPKSDVSAIGRELENLFIILEQDWNDLFNGNSLELGKKNWNMYVEKTKDVINDFFGNDTNDAAKNIAAMCEQDPAFKTEFLKDSKSAIDSHIDEINKNISQTQSAILDDDYSVEEKNEDNQQVL